MLSEYHRNIFVHAYLAKHITTYKNILSFFTSFLKTCLQGVESIYSLELDFRFDYMYVELDLLSVWDL